jgi:hypothetical protein
MPAAALLGSYRKYMHSQENHAAVVPMVQTGEDQTVAFDGFQHQGDDEVSGYMSCEPAPIDIAAFGKKVGEIIAKSMIGLPRRRKR